MAEIGKISKILQTIKNNWKKSLFAAGVLAYGVDYGIDQLTIRGIMRAYCQQAMLYGDSPINTGDHIRKIVVILNPAANKKRAKKQFENYCAPILNLSGVYINILETEKEGHARELVKKLDPDTDALVIAGGDGTLSETLTGLMRSRGELCKIPIGILPLGQRNSIASVLFGSNDSHNISKMANATLAVVKGDTKPIDAFRIETLKDDNSRPVYGVGSIEWGISRELRRRAENLWYFGPLNSLATLIFHGKKIHMEQNLGFIEANVRYSPPCSGCSSCYMVRSDLISEKVEPAKFGKWWNFVSLQNRRLQQKSPSVDYTKIINKNCNLIEEKFIDTSDLNLTTTTLDKSEISKISVKIGPKIKYQGDLLSEGFKILKKPNLTIVDTLEAKEIEIFPVESLIKHDEQDCLAIDNEDYEVRPIKITLLPNSVKVFCNK